MQVLKCKLKGLTSRLRQLHLSLAGVSALEKAFESFRLRLECTAIACGVMQHFMQDILSCGLIVQE